MWQRWSGHHRRNSSGGASANSPSSNPSFSFKDLRSLVDDESLTIDIAGANNNNSKAPLTPSSSALFRRVRAASSALRAWRSAASDPKKIVLYFTSLRIVRKTFEDCRSVRSILRGFRVAVDERDLSMDTSFLAELRKILGKRISADDQLTLPRVFIGGRYIGGAEEIQQLHESGELKKFVEGVPTATGVCEVCGGVRFVLCQTCSGSHKYYSEKKGFRTCNACNENGLLRCPECCGDD